MVVLRRANEQQQSDWLNVPEGTWRFTIAEPQLRLSEKYGNYQANFRLDVHPDERERVKEQAGPLEEDQKQSDRVYYTCGLSLGWVDKSGVYQTTKLIDFLAAALGDGGKGFRKWIGQGGGPNISPDQSDQEQLEAIRSWLGWWEGLEVYATVRHDQDKHDPTKVWPRVAGFIPVGSLPGQKDDQYQSLAKGKMRAMMAEAAGPRPDKTPEEVQQQANPKGARTYDEVFEKENTNELPFR